MDLVTLPQDHMTYQARLPLASLGRARRRELAAWLGHHCGRPDRQRGFWWSDEDTASRELVITFVLPEHFFEFSMRWM